MKSALAMNPTVTVFYPRGTQRRSPKKKPRRLNRPTEQDALYLAMRYEKMMRSANWRIAKFGCVRLTHREEQAIRLERQAFEHRYHLDGKIQAYVAVRMNCNQSTVSRTLSRASMVLELLENYPGLGIPKTESDIIEDSSLLLN